MKKTPARTPAKAKKSAAKPAAKPAAKVVTLKVGDPAPDFTLPTADGTITLSDLRGRNVVVYFYPKDDTPGCTKEACGFNDQLPNFSKLTAEIIGISKDSPASHLRFRDKYGLKFRLASDADGAVLAKYGTWVKKSLYGREYMGIERATFLIDGKGVIRALWRQVKVPGHVEAVLAAVKVL